MSESGRVATARPEGASSALGRPIRGHVLARESRDRGARRVTRAQIRARGCRGWGARGRRRGRG
jgi:hypothetical protein